MNKRHLLYLLVALLVFNLLFMFYYFQNSEDKLTEEYSPKISPSDFTSNVTNKYFALTPGKKMVYESETEEGKERIESPERFQAFLEMIKTGKGKLDEEYKGIAEKAEKFPYLRVQ